MTECVKYTWVCEKSGDDGDNDWKTTIDEEGWIPLTEIWSLCDSLVNKERLDHNKRITIESPNTIKINSGYSCHGGSDIREMKITFHSEKDLELKKLLNKHEIEKINFQIAVLKEKIKTFE